MHPADGRRSNIVGLIDDWGDGVQARDTDGSQEGPAGRGRGRLAWPPLPASRPRGRASVGGDGRRWRWQWCQLSNRLADDQGFDMQPPGGEDDSAGQMGREGGGVCR